MKLHERKSFVIMSKDETHIHVGKFPHARFELVTELKSTASIRLFPNIKMAENYILNNIKTRDELKERLGEDHISCFSRDELKVVEVIETITLK